MSKRAWILAVGVGCFGIGALATATVGKTYAAFSDFQVVQVRASAGTWNSPPPANPNEPQQCVDAGLTFDAAHTKLLPNGSNVYSTPSNATSGYLIVVGDGSAVITGSKFGDCIVAGKGSYAIHGGSGNDVLIDLGPGSGALYGEGGDDHLYGGPGSMALDGGSGNDYLYGGVGSSSLDGGSGNDHLYGGGPGSTTLTGGPGTDTCVRAAGNSTTSYSSCETHS